VTEPQLDKNPSTIKFCTKSKAATSAISSHHFARKFAEAMPANIAEIFSLNIIPNFSPGIWDSIQSEVGGM
jgi:hypothetical protein